jgi:hypothetical protein
MGLSISQKSKNKEKVKWRIPKWVLSLYPNG